MPASSIPSAECEETSRLAVVVPAYRARFLAEALESLARQTRVVPVHVFDDASPEPIAEICAAFRGRMPIRYRRFDSNLGGVDLAAHWNRCVAEVESPWIWVFSDDDIADPGCVAAFEQRVDAVPEVDAMCFRTRTIDAEGHLVREHAHPPALESALEYLDRRLSGERESFVPDHVFRRARWDAVGGFPSYPLAWHSDDAFWLRTAHIRGIAGLAPTVSWRRSGQNLSSFHPALCRRKFDALCRFDAFLHDDGWWRDLSCDPARGDRRRREWFWRAYRMIGHAFPPHAWPELRRGMARSFPQGGASILLSFFRAWLFRLAHPVR